MTDDPFGGVRKITAEDGDPFLKAKKYAPGDRERDAALKRILLRQTRGAAVESAYQELRKAWVQPMTRFSTTNRFGYLIHQPITTANDKMLRDMAKRQVEAEENYINNPSPEKASVGPITDPTQLRRFNQQTAFRKAEMQKVFNRSGVEGKGAEWVQYVNDLEPQIREAVKPIRDFATVASRGGLVGSIPGGDRLIGDLVGGAAEQVALAPAITIKTMAELTDPKVSVPNKLRSVGDFALNVVTLFSVGPEDVAAGLSKMLFKVGSKSAKAEIAAATAIREAMRAGVKPSEIQGYILQRMNAAGKAGKAVAPRVVEESTIRGVPSRGGNTPPNKQFGPSSIYVKPKNVVDVPKTTAVDVTEETLNRKALPAPGQRFTPKELPGYEQGSIPQLAYQAFINGAWRERTQGLINDLNQLISEQSGGGRRYGPLRRELERSLTEGVPHPSVKAELDDIFKAQVAPALEQSAPALPKPKKGARKNATEKGLVAESNQQQHLGIDGQVQGEGINRNLPAKIGEGGPKTGRGNRAIKGGQAETAGQVKAEIPGSTELDPFQTKTEIPQLETRQVKPRVIPAKTRIGEATTPDLKTKIRTQDELVELDDLVVSHDLQGQPNKNFPQEIQNRDRGRTSALDQVNSRAANLEPSALIDDFRSTDRGSPIIDDGNVVISGNGRTMSLKAARDLYGPKWEAYRQALIAQYPEAANMQNPVLVRRVLDPLDVASRKALAEASNEAGVARLSAFEEAVNDAKNILDNFSDTFTMRGKSLQDALDSPSNRDLVQSIVNKIPENERAAMFDAGGQLSETGRGRVARAMLYKIFGDDAKTVLGKAFEEGEFSKRIMGGMEQASGDLATLTKEGNHVAAEMRGKITDALKFADEAMSQKRTSALSWFDQGSLDYRDPGAMAIAKALVSAKSKEQVASIVSKLARAAEDSEGGIFADELGFRTADDAIDAVLPQVAATDLGGPGLFGDVDALREAATVYGPPRPGGKQSGALMVPNFRDPFTGIVQALKETSLGRAYNNVKQVLTAHLGNAFDIVKSSGPTGKRISQDMERILTESAAMTANYGLRLKEAIKANFGRIPGLTQSSRQSLGLSRTFEDIVTKVENGAKLTPAERRVWNVWVGINEEIAGIGERKGVMIQRTVGEWDLSKLKDRRVSFVKDGIPLTGIVEDTTNGLTVRTAEGRFRLKWGDQFWSGSLADPTTYFPRELKPGIMDALMREGSAEHSKAIEHLIAKQFAKDQAQAETILRKIMYPGEVVVESPVKSKLRLPRFGQLLPDEFYNRNFAEVAEKHIARTALDIASANVWDGDFAKLTELLKGLPMNKRAKVLETIKMGLGMHYSGPESRIIAAEGAYQAATKLSGLQTAVIQASQASSNIGVLGVRAALRGAWDAFADIFKGRKMLDQIKLSGVIDEDILSLHGFEDLRGLGRGVTNLALTPMKAVDRVMRVPAAKAGLYAVDDLLKKVQVIGKEIKNNAAYRTLSEWFSYTDDDIRRMKTKGLSDSDKLMAMRGGVKTQITTRAADVPFHVNQVPALRMLWRFRTFAYGQAKLFGWTAKEAARGNPVPLLRLIVGSALVGEGVLEAKERSYDVLAAIVHRLSGAETTPPESKRKSLAEIGEKGWMGYAERGWSNVLETGSLGLYKDAYEQVDPNTPAYKKSKPAPIVNTIGNVLESIAYGSKTEGDFVEKVKAGFGNLTNEEIVLVRQIYKLTHDNRTFRQDNPMPESDDEE